MKPHQIKLGRTYIGAKQERRFVSEITPEREVYYSVNNMGHFMPLKDFAAWAKQEAQATAAESIYYLARLKRQGSR